MSTCIVGVFSSISLRIICYHNSRWPPHRHNWVAVSLDVLPSRSPRHLCRIVKWLRVVSRDYSAHDHVHWTDCYDSSVVSKSLCSDWSCDSIDVVPDVQRDVTRSCPRVRRAVEPQLVRMHCVRVVDWSDVGCECAAAVTRCEWWAVAAARSLAGLWEGRASKFRLFYKL